MNISPNKNVTVYDVKLTEDELINLYAMCMSIGGDLRREFSFPLSVQIRYALQDLGRPSSSLFSEYFTSQSAKTTLDKWQCPSRLSQTLIVDRKR